MDMTITNVLLGIGYQVLALFLLFTLTFGLPLILKTLRHPNLYPRNEQWNNQHPKPTGITEDW